MTVERNGGEEGERGEERKEGGEKGGREGGEKGEGGEGRKRGREGGGGGGKKGREERNERRQEWRIGRWRTTYLVPNETVVAQKIFIPATHLGGREDGRMGGWEGGNRKGNEME